MNDKILELLTGKEVLVIAGGLKVNGHLHDVTPPAEVDFKYEVSQGLGEAGIEAEKSIRFYPDSVASIQTSRSTPKIYLRVKEGKEDE